MSMDEPDTVAGDESAAPTYNPLPTPPVDAVDPRSTAIRSIRRKREFWGHCTAYVIVNGLLVAMWLVLAVTAHAWFFWPVFPLIGWGIGLAFHASAVFGRAGRPITEAEIAAEERRLARR